jgi:hypothetical protein
MAKKKINKCRHFNDDGKEITTPCEHKDDDGCCGLPSSEGWMVKCPGNENYTR